ncbi:MAG: hypothetical protein UMV23_06035 [Halanaerobium sp.]|nr:hypothetical protein [Halanaerobium sp.]
MAAFASAESWNFSNGFPTDYPLGQWLIEEPGLRILLEVKEYLGELYDEEYDVRYHFYSGLIRLPEQTIEVTAMPEDIDFMFNPPTKAIRVVEDEYGYTFDVMVDNDEGMVNIFTETLTAFPEDELHIGVDIQTDELESSTLYATDYILVRYEGDAAVWEESLKPDFSLWPKEEYMFKYQIFMMGAEEPSAEVIEYVGHHKMRDETRADGQSFIDIEHYLPDHIREITLMPAEKQYFESEERYEDKEDLYLLFKVLPGEVEMPSEEGSIQKLGTETIMGRKTEKWQMNFVEDGEEVEIVYWIDKELRLVIKAVGGSASYSYKMEPVELKIGKQPDSLFEIPADYEPYGTE